MLPLRQFIQGIDGQDCVAAHIRVPVVKAGKDGGYERLKDLHLPYPAEEPQGDAPQVLVGVLKVVPKVLADKNLQIHIACSQEPRMAQQLRIMLSKDQQLPHHLRQELPTCVCLLDCLLQGSLVSVMLPSTLSTPLAARTPPPPAPGTAGAASGRYGPPTAARSARW